MTGSMQLPPGGALAKAFHSLRKGFFDPYRPELHYMRGPGPKWREKHEGNAPFNIVRPRPSAGLRWANDDAHPAAH